MDFQYAGLYGCNGPCFSCLQFLNRSISHTANVVNTLAAFGLAYVIVKFFVGVLAEVKQAGLVLVLDRPSFFKILVCVVALSTSVVLLIIVTGESAACKTHEIYYVCSNHPHSTGIVLCVRQVCV